MKRKPKLIIAIVIIFLIITNPSPKSFKDYLGVSQTNLNARRNFNFIIFSIYKEEYQNQASEAYGVTSSSYSYKHYYLGIAENFFNLNYK